MSLIDPTKFTSADLPLGLQCNNKKDLLGNIIDWITRGQYCHSCGMITPGQIATQDWVFTEIPLSDYLIPSEYIQFWRIKDATPEEKALIINAVKKRLKLPWWARMYNIPSLLGQAIGVHWFQLPYLCICSKETAEDYIQSVPRVWDALSEAERTTLQNPNPVGELGVIDARPDLFEIVGYWQN